MKEVRKDGWTPLHAAADQGHVAVARLLLEHGAEVKRSNSFGFRPLQTATQRGKFEMIQLVLSKGAF